MLVASAHLAVAVAVAPRSASASPRDLVARPIALAPGELDARLVVELGLYKLAEPISLAPDVWFGVAPRWTLGVIHSAQSLGLIDDGATLCFRGRPPYGCDRAYNGSGVDVRWSWLAGPLAVAPRARFVLRDVEPWKPAVTAGALVRWTRGRFAVTSDPYLRLGLANRDRGNRAALVLPLRLALQPTCRWLVAIHGGWDAELAVLRDGWRGPVALAIEARAASHLHVSVEGGFRSLLGPQQDLRAITAAITIAWRPRDR
jgi:hypothetical protein